ncbi:hypothetical protein CERSUDRAFT_89866 [Gelatoporia subvermispora B]|uniref:DUF6534 domain-containing protein n=1 Tax=Ceriporiopsis subvermispora (strain B) TaxID=914234 RepID=M2PWT2_CERS8|nr:hypothetical protein CERSUDRAFT_89866 [Gelatoporia subvermispora B]
MSLPDSAIHSLVEPNCGALLLGTGLSSVLFGVTLLQTYQYYDQYWDDPTYMKFFVAIIAIFDAADLILVFATVWHYLISNYGNVSSIAIIPVQLGWEVGMTISVAFLAHGFFAMRVWLTGGRRILIPFAIIVLSIGEFVIGTYYNAKAQEAGLASALPRLAWAAVATHACNIAADFLITITLCHYLHRSRSGFKRTDKLINVLTIYIVNTGLLNTICAAAVITLVIVLNKTLWYAVPGFLVSKFYVNSVLATLNAREKLRRMPGGSMPDSVQVELREVRVRGLQRDSNAIRKTHCLRDIDQELLTDVKVHENKL